MNLKETNVTEKERVLLIAIDRKDGEFSIKESLMELEELTMTAGAEVVGIIVQNRETAHNKTYVGTGKIEEIRDAVWELDADTVIADDELSPNQLKALNDLLGVRVMDRTTLILDIFAQRAQTREGLIQVELAQLGYRITRLSGIGKELSRQGGGIGAKGPGEKKLETDKRYIRSRMNHLRKELKEVVAHRDLIRTKRKENQMPVIALVGYTNAGKSTLFNLLTEANVLEEDKLFATLDSTTRKKILPSKTEVLFIDTVGFINKLPHHLVEAFNSTLEEAKFADIILHVVDASDVKNDMQMNVTAETLGDLGVLDYPIVTVFNKIDKDEVSFPPLAYDAKSTVKISARQGEGIDELLGIIDKILAERRKKLTLLLPYDQGHLVNTIRASGQLLLEAYQEDGILVECYIEDRFLSKLKPYEVIE